MLLSYPNVVSSSFRRSWTSWRWSRRRSGRTVWRVGKATDGKDVRRSRVLVSIVIAASLAACVLMFVGTSVAFAVRPREGWYVSHVESVVLPQFYASHGRWPTNGEVSEFVRNEKDPTFREIMQDYDPVLTPNVVTPSSYRGTLRFRHLFGGKFAVQTQPDSWLREHPLTP